MGDLNFDANTVEPNDSFDPMPTGWYTMIVNGAEMVHSDKAGEMLKLKLEIDANAHPQFVNRKAFDNLCLNHPNSEKAREIAQRTLSSICRAIGRMQLNSSEELIGGHCQVKLLAVPAKDGYDAKNEVRGYKALGSGSQSSPASAAPPPAAAAAPAPAAQSAPPAQAAAAAPAGNGTPPWKNNG